MVTLRFCCCHCQGIQDCPFCLRAVERNVVTSDLLVCPSPIYSTFFPFRAEEQLAASCFKHLHGACRERRAVRLQLWGNLVCRRPGVPNDRKAECLASQQCTIYLHKWRGCRQDNEQDAGPRRKVLSERQVSPSSEQAPVPSSVSANEQEQEVSIGYSMAMYHDRLPKEQEEGTGC